MTYSVTAILKHCMLVCMALLTYSSYGERSFYKIRFHKNFMEQVITHNLNTLFLHMQTIDISDTTLSEIDATLKNTVIKIKAIHDKTPLEGSN